LTQATLSAGCASPASARVGVLRLLAISLALTCLSVLAIPALTGTAAALNKATRGVGAKPSATEPHWLCPEGSCEAIVAPRPVKVGTRFALPGSSRLFEGGGELGGYDPADLTSAYTIPSGTEGAQTVAVVDAFGYPNAEADLATYRSRYGLPACTKANGCFKKVNEKGEEANYPGENANWQGESALDLDMVSAACPECHIILMEASTELTPQLPAAVNEAVALGANEVSNSYGLPELYEPWCGTTRCEPYNAAYQHPGVEIFASAGDQGYMDTYWKAKYGLAYQTNFPASVPGVIAVGGTALFHKEGGTRGWSEAVWDETGRQIGTGAGCTVAQAKPAWQTDLGCAHRTVSDLAADAAVETGVSVRINGAWQIYGGTSVSSPLMAGIAAHASATVRAEGAAWFYSHPSAFHDVTSGFAGFEAGECTPNLYLCNGEIGYDGPTGLGTPGASAEPPASPTAAITAPLPNKTFVVGAKVKTTFSCTEGARGPGLESCIDSNGAAAGIGKLNTAVPGIYTYTATAKSLDGLTGTSSIKYAVAPKGYRAYDMCLSTSGCGFVFLVNTLAKLWQLPAFGESGTIQTVTGKPTKTDFLTTSETGNGCVHVSVKNSTGYNSEAHPGNFECGGVTRETWYASVL
jgi:hypothetical protein